MSADDETYRGADALWAPEHFHARGMQSAPDPLGFPGQGKRDWSLRVVRVAPTGTYYALRIPVDVRTGVDTVMVKHSTGTRHDHDTCVCMTHLVADRCPHTRFVRDYLEGAAA